MRVLIAEDESIIRLGLKAMLQQMSHEVIMAADGREALHNAHLYHPDFAILDIKMPFTDGLRAAQTLARTQPMPILVLTAFSEQDLIERPAEFPIHGYLIKPIQPAELGAAMAVAVKRFEEAQALATRMTELEETLETRKLVDRAKGKLMESGLTDQDAYRALQRQARATRQTIRQVARAVLDR